MEAANIPDVLGFVESALSQLKVNRKLAGKTALVCEETLVMLLRAAPEGADLQVQIRRFFGDVSVILSTIHVPIEALGLIIAINPIMDMCETVTNTTGDVAAALIAAKSEKLLDESIYRK